MTFTIPNQADALYPAQSAVDKVDIEILALGYIGNGISGAGASTDCLVSAQASPNMTVAVAAGTCTVYGSANVAIAAGNLTVGTADATNPRFDMISVSNAGTKTITAGTASANPVFPAIPLVSGSPHTVLAMIYVAPGVTSIVAGAIIDKRIWSGINGSVIFTGSMVVGGLVDISGAVAGQIKFPAAQHASTNANTFDDYEEGTWTPVIHGDNGSGNHDYSATNGYYTKIGQYVFIDFFVQMTLKDAGMTGTYAQIFGLPFAKNASHASYTAIPMAYWGWATSAASLTGHLQQGNTFMFIFYVPAAGATLLGTVGAPADINNGTLFAGSGGYNA